MAVISRNIIPAKHAENSQATQYTSVNATTVIDEFSATNISSGNVIFSVNLITSGGTAAATNRVLSLRAIAPNETYLCPELIGQVLESGGFISTLADTASAITIRASGRVIT